jgi:hypothetical protein
LRPEPAIAPPQLRPEQAAPSQLRPEPAIAPPQTHSASAVATTVEQDDVDDYDEDDDNCGSWSGRIHQAMSEAGAQSSSSQLIPFKGEGEGSLGTTLQATKPITYLERPMPHKRVRDDVDASEKRIARKQCRDVSCEYAEHCEIAFSADEVETRLNGSYFTPLDALWDGDWCKVQKNGCVLWKGLKKSRSGQTSSNSYEWFNGVFHGWDTKDPDFAVVS